MPSVIWYLVIAFGCFLAFQVWRRFSPRQQKRRALMEATARGDLAAMKEIVTPGFSLNFDFWCELSWRAMGSPLSNAVARGDRTIADFLIAGGASLSPKSPGNDALLTNAVRGGNFELVDLALKAGHDINFQPDKRSTPLATAIQYKNIPMARFLISRGARKIELRVGNWHQMNGELILFIHGLGVEVPPDVWTAVKNGQWDPPPKSRDGSDR